MLCSTKKSLQASRKSLQARPGPHLKLPLRLVRPGQCKAGPAWPLRNTVIDPADPLVSSGIDTRSSGLFGGCFTTGRGAGVFPCRLARGGSAVWEWDTRCSIHLMLDCDTGREDYGLVERCGSREFESRTETLQKGRRVEGMKKES